VRAVEGPLFLLPCANETAHRICHDCADAEVYGTRLVMQGILTTTACILDGLTLEDICDLSRVELSLAPVSIHGVPLR